MKTFRLHDHSGRYVHCVALGRHVDNDCLAHLNEVVLYFATAKAGLNNGAGQLWMYDESHIVLVGNRYCVPPASICMELR